jgi:hypothetical protein
MSKRSDDLVVRNALARKRAILTEIAEVNEFIETYRKMAKAGPYRAMTFFVEKTEPQPR